ncbi:YwqG family protein [Flavobacterium ardleyense]|uniref:YwqG family protein n=1 Tax=Flavobacterium ardleyense TaxID=2038737 RepID=A0ABW5Z5S0_9FLAO
MNKFDLKEKFTELKIGSCYNIIEPTLKNAIRVKLNQVSENKIDIGQSKIGGKPDLPLNQKWFTETNIEIIQEKKLFFLNKKSEKEITKSLSFLAQINLSEIKNYDTENLLPQSGMLYFFYSSAQSAWGFDFKDINKFKVFFYDEDLNNLRRNEFPENLEEDGKFKSCELKFESEISLPSCDSEIYERLKEEEMDLIFEEILNEETVNKLLGHPDIIQNEMELECELVTNGIYCGDASGYNNPKAKELEKNAKDWQLLFQIDTNEEAEMMWGDCGRIYFWIKKEDLKNKNFENCWMILQCY